MKEWKITGNTYICILKQAKIVSWVLWFGINNIAKKISSDLKITPPFSQENYKKEFEYIINVAKKYVRINMLDIDYEISAAIKELRNGFC